MHKCLELANLLHQEFESIFQRLADDRVTEAVEEFKTRFPKRSLCIRTGYGFVNVEIDGRPLDWQYRPLYLDGTQAKFFEFIAQAIEDAELIFGGNTVNLTEIKVEPTSAKSQQKAVHTQEDG